jgi:LysM repeat protein
MSSTYTVKAGDSCWSIANKFGNFSVDDLKNVNTIYNPSFNCNSLQIGQLIYLPSNISGNTVNQVANTANTYTSSVYTVQSGDIPSIIASKNGITVGALLSLNPNITDWTKLQIGQQLNVNTGTGISSYSSVKTYTAVSGDTVYSIASKNGITQTQFYQWNPSVNSTNPILYIGQVYNISDPSSSNTQVVPPSNTQVVPPSNTQVVPPSNTQVVPPSNTQAVPQSNPQAVPQSNPQAVPPSNTISTPAYQCWNTKGESYGNYNPRIVEQGWLNWSMTTDPNVKGMSVQDAANYYCSLKDKQYSIASINQPTPPSNPQVVPPSNPQVVPPSNPQAVPPSNPQAVPPSNQQALPPSNPQAVPPSNTISAPAYQCWNTKGESYGNYNPRIVEQGWLNWSMTTDPNVKGMSVQDAANYYCSLKDKQYSIASINQPTLNDSCKVSIDTHQVMINDNNFSSNVWSTAKITKPAPCFTDNLGKNSYIISENDYISLLYFQGDLMKPKFHLVNDGLLLGVMQNWKLSMGNRPPVAYTSIDKSTNYYYVTEDQYNQLIQQIQPPQNLINDTPYNTMKANPMYNTLINKNPWEWNNDDAQNCLTLLRNLYPKNFIDNLVNKLTYPGWKILLTTQPNTSMELLNKYPNWNSNDSENARNTIKYAIGASMNTANQLVYNSSIDTLKKLDLYFMLLAGWNSSTPPSTQQPIAISSCTGSTAKYTLVDSNTNHLEQCQSITSNNGLFKFVLQSDGNAVVYDTSNNSAPWATTNDGGLINTGDPPYSLTIDDNNNLKIYDSVGYNLYTKNVKGKKLNITNKGRLNADGNNFGPGNDLWNP